MKIKTILLFVSVGLCALLLTSCSDDGSSAPAEPVDTFDAAVVCPAEGTNAYGDPNRGTFTDARDGQVYKYTTIGNQVWMAENLKFDAPYSVCYDKIDGFCDTFGRFYSLREDGGQFGLLDRDLLDTVCPAGWHVPSMDEWNVLANSMGVGGPAMARLKSSERFDENYEPGTDDCGFSSLPAGEMFKTGDVSGAYSFDVYWTSTAMNLQSTYAPSLNSYRGISFGQGAAKMVLRCVKD